MCKGKMGLMINLAYIKKEISSIIYLLLARFGMVICLWLHEGRTSVVPTSNGKPTVDDFYQYHQTTCSLD